jgi:maleylpyruvate isomerase
MDTDFPNLDETVVATARYLSTLSDLTDDDVRRPSLLPGWTVGHVITHLSRNADALSNVLHGAQAGEVRSMYPTSEQRDADIEEGAGRSAAALRAEAVASSGRWVQAANEVHSANLEAQGRRTPDAETWPVRRVGMMRRTEVEVHHADLGLGYTAADWPSDFVEALMKRRHRELTDRGIGLRWAATDTGATWETGAGPEVTGTAAAIVWWLLGRSQGDDLECSAGTLPELGRWA